MEKTKAFSPEFVESQKQIILSRIAKYLNKQRIQEELRDGDVSPYILYKQKYVLPQLQKALLLIQNGDYGICQKCGNPIEINRLILVPAAFHCIKCLTQKSS